MFAFSELSGFSVIVNNPLSFSYSFRSPGYAFIAIRRMSTFISILSASAFIVLNFWEVPVLSTLRGFIPTLRFLRPRFTPSPGCLLSGRSDPSIAARTVPAPARGFPFVQSRGQRVPVFLSLRRFLRWGMRELTCCADVKYLREVRQRFSRVPTFSFSLSLSPSRVSRPSAILITGCLSRFPAFGFLSMSRRGLIPLTASDTAIVIVSRPSLPPVPLNRGGPC